MTYEMGNVHAVLSAFRRNPNGTNPDLVLNEYGRQADNDRASKEREAAAVRQQNALEQGRLERENALEQGRLEREAALALMLEQGRLDREAAALRQQELFGAMFSGAMSQQKQILAEVVAPMAATITGVAANLEQAPWSEMKKSSTSLLGPDGPKNEYHDMKEWETPARKDGPPRVTFAKDVKAAAANNIEEKGTKNVQGPHVTFAEDAAAVPETRVIFGQDVDAAEVAADVPGSGVIFAEDADTEATALEPRVIFGEDVHAASANIEEVAGDVPGPRVISAENVDAATAAPESRVFFAKDVDATAANIEEDAADGVDNNASEAAAAAADNASKESVPIALDNSANIEEDAADVIGSVDNNNANEAAAAAADNASKESVPIALDNSANISANVPGCNVPGNNSEFEVLGKPIEYNMDPAEYRQYVVLENIPPPSDSTGSAFDMVSSQESWDDFDDHSHLCTSEALRGVAEWEQKVARQVIEIRKTNPGYPIPEFTPTVPFQLETVASEESVPGSPRSTVDGAIQVETVTSEDSVPEFSFPSLRSTVDGAVQVETVTSEESVQLNHATNGAMIGPSNQGGFVSSISSMIMTPVKVPLRLGQAVIQRIRGSSFGSARPDNGAETGHAHGLPCTTPGVPAVIVPGPSQESRTPGSLGMASTSNGPNPTSPTSTGTPQSNSTARNSITRAARAVGRGLSCAIVETKTFTVDGERREFSVGDRVRTTTDNCEGVITGFTTKKVKIQLFNNTKQTSRGPGYVIKIDPSTAN